MIYLVKENGKVRVFHSEEEMKAAGFKKADKTVSEELFNSNGCYAKIVNGSVIVGKTTEEKAAEEKQEKLSEILEKLEQIDRESGASRQVRDVSVSAGVVLDAVRILLARFAKELEISIPAGFDSGITSAADILSLAPPSNATPKEKADFAVFKALLLLSYYDPAINPGLTIIREAEEKAAPIRMQLAEIAV